MAYLIKDRMSSDSMIKIESLDIYYGSGAGRIQAVSGASFEVAPAECFGLVGESGSGKTTVLKALMGLAPDWRGTMIIDGQRQTVRRQPGIYKTLQMVFQDPYASLHPRHTVNRILSEPLKIHGMTVTDAEIHGILNDVGLGPKFRYRFPHQLSGGQRQRVAIARALVLKPKILLLDEPTSALDVSVQAEILNLLRHIQQTYGLTYLLVSHNLAVISHMCHRLVVMKRGEILEGLSVEALRAHEPGHPYTQSLLAASIGPPDG